ncbi:hypothetical protein ACM42_02490 [Bradyrhizobium sp. CCBAU 25338]|uniref:hypothetical protein n=1 Tax=Bradyrhizobium sp. CCBAU 45389 TaxID=858429 RepID=UPI001027C71A|nr:hypothetical protein [Bradyrhizobium sp. CCBAU 45389]MDA9400930.1 hypothetical protein [Bradyrhizobium sp. CCBAU 45389]MDA9527320.1 hypothetical protein [Bradyrhizobium sp. CCBAU 25338]RXH24296.1 hypothetical protein XH84_32980 [Bradyrhizobium nanningense]
MYVSYLYVSANERELRVVGKEGRQGKRFRKAFLEGDVHQRTEAASSQPANLGNLKFQTAAVMYDAIIVFDNTIRSAGQK